VACSPMVSDEADRNSLLSMVLRPLFLRRPGLTIGARARSWMLIQRDIPSVDQSTASHRVEEERSCGFSAYRMLALLIATVVAFVYKQIEIAAYSGIDVEFYRIGGISFVFNGRPAWQNCPRNRSVQCLSPLDFYVEPCGCLARLTVSERTKSDSPHLRTTVLPVRLLAGSRWLVDAQGVGWP